MSTHVFKCISTKYILIDINTYVLLYIHMYEI